MTAQVEAWLGVHKGSIDEISRVAQQTFADAALARMMLHRRRAAVAEVISEFFIGVGECFAPHLQGGVSRAPADVNGEIVAAKTAGDIVDSVCGSVPPLLFERALLAEMDGRRTDALADLDRLLDAYPGFLVAATAAARLALAAGEPDRAIRSLACLEQELKHTREGSALLADALHAVRSHESASRYDLATLMCLGHRDSHGNDCAPVDLMGSIASDIRMPLAFLVENLPDGRVLYNDRGIYYLASFLHTGLLSGLLNAARSVLPIRSGVEIAKSDRRAMSRLLEVLPPRLGLFLLNHKPKATTLQWLRAGLTSARQRISGIKAAAERLIKIVWVRLEYLSFRSYKRLPIPARHLIRVCVPSRMRPWIARYFSGYGKWLFEVLDGDRLSQTVQARFQSGIAQIFPAQRSPGPPGKRD